MTMIKQDIDAWLDQVDYKILNSSKYIPSEFALTFMNFIKLASLALVVMFMTGCFQVSQTKMNKEGENGRNILPQSAGKIVFFTAVVDDVSVPEYVDGMFKSMDPVP